MTGRRFNGAIFLLDSHFLHIKGLHVTNVLQPASGELVSGLGASLCSNLTTENVEASNVCGRGMSYWGIAGHPEAAHIEYDTTRYINCDVFNCGVLLSEVPGNGSDAWKLDNESAGYLYFSGCRAWGCGHGGFDISGSGVTVFDHCWSFDQNFPGALEGNGLKFYGNRGDDARIGPDGQFILGTQVEGVRKVVKNCIAVNNVGIGFYDLGYKPYYPNNARVYNNSLYKNGIGIQMAINGEYPGQNPGGYRNNIIFGTRETDAPGRPYHLCVTYVYIESNNTWNYADVSIVGSIPWWQPFDELPVTDEDFLSLDWSQLSRPRKADGYLPDITFVKLAPSSGLIDAGTDVGISFLGLAPDIGAFEYDPEEIVVTDPSDERDFGITVYPNPANGRVWIQTKESGLYRFRVLDISVRELISSRGNLPAGSNHLLGLPSLMAGVYILEVKMGDTCQREKLVVY